MAVDLHEITIDDIRKLDVATRRRLLVEIGQTLSEEEPSLALTKEQEEELDRRLAEYDANPEEGEDWRVVMEEIRKKWLDE